MGTYGLLGMRVFCASGSENLSFSRIQLIHLKGIGLELQLDGTESDRLQSFANKFERSTSVGKSTKLSPNFSLSLIRRRFSSLVYAAPDPSIEATPPF